MKEFYDLADFSNQEIGELLKVAAQLEHSPEVNALNGKVLALLFLNPSLRTLTSLQASMTRGGGGTLGSSPERFALPRASSSIARVVRGSGFSSTRHARTRLEKLSTTAC